jgi:hypothetical protein
MTAAMTFTSILACLSLTVAITMTPTPASSTAHQSLDGDDIEVANPGVVAAIHDGASGNMSANINQRPRVTLNLSV